MKGKSQEEIGTDRLLKSKYSHKDKQKTIALMPGNSKKIMLTDLCPQEKLKVGQLIKINEARRLQIEELLQQTSQMKSRLADCQIHLCELDKQSKAQAEQNNQLENQLTKINEKLANKQSYILDLQNQKKQLLQEAAKKAKIVMCNYGIQTKEIDYVNNSTQTKKQKTKDRIIQTQMQEEYEEKNEEKFLQRNVHSKSFENVGRNKWTPNQKRNNSQRQSLNSHSHSLRDDHKFVQKEYLEDDMDQCFSDLTQKWLELKQKNLSKLKAQYEQSRQKFYQEPQLETFGPKQLLLQPEMITQKGEQNDIDDVELNKLLKSNNFSASRLLNSKGNMTSSQNSRKQTVYMDSVNTEQTKGQKRQPLQTKNHQLNIGNQKKIEKVKKGETKMNYLDDDLMDIVDSLE